jgi:ABC-type branched-subunit amino acid transport system permease subunit
VRPVFVRSWSGVGRWIGVGVGTALMVWSLVRLIDVGNRAAQAPPWWWLGLMGLVLTVSALGSPWSRRTADRPADGAQIRDRERPTRE